MGETTGTGAPRSQEGPGGARGTTHVPARNSPAPSGASRTDPGRPDTPRGARVVHESYSFACLRCGHGWEQSYAIEHHADAQGKEFVVYRTDGRRVPSPLSQPTCDQCDGHVVRIMRPGRVSTVLDSMRESAHGCARRAGGTARPRGAGVRAGRAGRHVWHLPNLVRLLSLHRRPR